jgi:DNA invertase Pin-like site-specific DNA recombinase
VFGRPLNSHSKVKKLDAKEAEIKKLLECGTSMSAIARIIGAHRITVANIIRERGWESHFSEGRKKVMESYKKAFNKRPKFKIKVKYPVPTASKQEILDLYRELKSLSKIAEKLGTTGSILKTWLQKKDYWDDLVELDTRLRKEAPSLKSKGENFRRYRN